MQSPNSAWEIEMSIELKMPALSPTMEKGTIARWLVKPGDLIKAGDLIAEVETDKAAIEVEADGEGRIARLLYDDGAENVAVGSVIAVLVSEGETGSADKVALPEAQANHAPAEHLHQTAQTAVVPAAIPAQADPPTSLAQPLEAGVLASPLARRIAAVEGMSLAAIKGTGPRGKILRADFGRTAGIGAAATPAPVAPIAAPAAIWLPPTGVPVETIKLSTMQNTIARRLTESGQQVPHF